MNKKTPSFYNKLLGQGLPYLSINVWIFTQSLTFAVSCKCVYVLLEVFACLCPLSS